MSTIVFAQNMNSRDVVQPPPHVGATAGQTPTPAAGSKSGISAYSDALSALVPAEVLTVHALVISTVTAKVDDGSQITDLNTLWWAFYGMCLLSIFLYVVPRLMGGWWDQLDFLRMLIPLFAFVGWTMLQPTSAFDAIAPSLTIAQRTIAAVFLGVFLGACATVLAYKADAKQ
jgi:hypothetical protein